MWKCHRPEGGLTGGSDIELPARMAHQRCIVGRGELHEQIVGVLPIVNGFGRQEPPTHGETMTVIKTFPEPEAIQMLREIGVRYVVLHTGRATELRQSVVNARRDSRVTLIGQFGEDYLFAISPADDSY